MNTTHHPQPCTADAGAAQAASLPAHRQIKLALDVHAAASKTEEAAGLAPSRRE